MHPASSIDKSAVFKRLYTSLTGGKFWDQQSVKARPDLKMVGTEHIDYEWEGLHAHGFSDIEEPESFNFSNPLITGPIARWIEYRIEQSHNTLLALPIYNGKVKAYRLIQTHLEDIRPELGLYWSHTVDNWDDPRAPWGQHGDQTPTYRFEAMVPAEAVDWETSCAALCDWYCGDMESELRLQPGHHLTDVTAIDVATYEPVELPNPARGWRT